MNAQPHGTRARYAAGCGCEPCKAGNRAYENHRARQAVYGRPTTNLIDAEPARQHVRALLAAGMGARSIAAAGGVNRNWIKSLLHGRPDRGNPPTQRIRPETADALLAVTVALPDHTLTHAAGTHRRLQALVACGWSIQKIANRLGKTTANLWAVTQQDRVTAATVRQVRDLYNQMWDQAPPETTWRERQSVSRARNLAAARGWLRPMEWDDDLIDLPQDELAAEVARRVALMDETELRRAHTSWRAHKDRTPLMVAAGREYARLLQARRAAA